METTKLAIFSASRSCDAGLRFNGKRIVIEGHVHSNGEFRVNSGNAPDHLYATSGTIAHGNCVAVIDPVPNGSRFGDGADFLPTEGEELGWPEWFTPEQLGRYLRRESTSGGTAYRGEEIEVTATHLRVSGKPDIPLTVDADGTTVIPTGTYCATKRFTISGDNHRGEITALAPEIYVEGNGQNYAPHVDGMLFFAVPNITSSATDDDAYDPMSVVGGTYPPTPPCSPSPGREMVLNGNNYEWAGVIFNPCGRVKINSQRSVPERPGLGRGDLRLRGRDQWRRVQHGWHALTPGAERCRCSGSRKVAASGRSATVGPCTP